MVVLEKYRRNTEINGGVYTRRFGIPTITSHIFNNNFDQKKANKYEYKKDSYIPLIIEMYVHRYYLLNR